ncbi:MAG: hypothetical protein EOO48_02740 [Flavobacterium sp.]|nr:MAG: hypothetical protein EOO48_02740 [Flavobacterium sp.]
MNVLSIVRKTSVAFCALILFACSSSGDSKTKIKYVVHADSQMITSIMYRDSNGDMQEGLTEVIVDWNKTINVDTPFSANLVVSFNNVSSSTSAYYLAIYRNGESEPSEYVPGIVPASAITTGTATLEVAD